MGRAGLVAAMTVVAASAVGCGGSGDDEASTDPSTDAGTSAEIWAADVCSSVSTWDGVVTEAGSTLSAPQDLSANAFKDAVDSVVDATETLVADVASLGPPDTEAGEDAQQQVENLSDSLQTEADVLSRAIDADSDTPTELLANLSTITGTLSNMTADVRTALSGIEALDGGAELQEAFASAETCQAVAPAG